MHVIVRSSLLASFSLSLIASRPVLAQAEAALTLVASRFRAAAGDSSRVMLLCRVPYVLLDPLSPAVGAARGSAVAAYRLTLRMRDSGGAEVGRHSRSHALPDKEDLERPGGAALERYDIVLPPGRYTVDAILVDSASGRTSASRLDLRIPDAAAAMSDVLVGSGLRVARGSADTMPRSGELRADGVFLAGAPAPVLNASRPRLAYYVERYDSAATPAAVWVEDSLGHRPWRRGAAATRGVLSLPALAPGNYRFVFALPGANDTITRAAGFTVAFPTGSAVQAAPGGSDPFALATESRLDSLYGPLVYLMRNDERGQFGGLSVEGKRAYLRRFWERRDPTPGTPRNEALEDFSDRVAVVSRLYREGGAAEVPGWRTDRGRIYLRYGPPDAVLSRPQPGSTNPYEIWKYTRARARKFVFFDLTRFGNYALIWTNELLEPSRPNWRELLGGEALEDVARF